MKVLVTGCLGFVGTNLILELLKNKDYEVYGIDNGLINSKGDELDFFVKKLNLLLSNGFIENNFYSVDFSGYVSKNLINENKFDCVVHLAAQPRVLYSIENPYSSNEENVSKTIKLFENLKNNCNKIIFASSAAVYGNIYNLPVSENTKLYPLSPYGLQKKIIEEYSKMFCSLYDFNIVNLRFFNIYGPYQYGNSPYSTAVSSWLNCIKNNKKLRLDGDGEQTRDMVYVKDICNSIILSMQSNYKFSGECINIGSGEKISNNEILNYLKNIYPNIDIEKCPERQGDIKHIVSDISLANKILKYFPKFSFEKGINETISLLGF